MLRKLKDPKAIGIGAILLLALLLRLPGIHYGLPYHLFGDEEANVYGALEMIQLHTLLPVFHQAQFDLLLYYPPVLAYIYVILFLPAIGILYLFLHLTSHVSLHGLQDMLTVDPSMFFYIGRSLGVILSLADIYMVYRLALHFFKKESVALLSALFLATSFFDVTIAPTTHHWIPGLFFSMVSLMLTVKALAPRQASHDEARSAALRRRYLMLAGISIGLSFGISYLVYFMPFILAYIAYDAGAFGMADGRLRLSFERGRVRQCVRDWTRFLSPFFIVAVIVVAVHPSPFFMQVVHHTGAEPGTTKTVSGFFIYYLGILWHDEAPLLIGSLMGAVFLLWKRRDQFCLFGIFFLTAMVLTYAFLYNIARYLMPVLPFLSLFAGYGLYELVKLIPDSKTALKRTAIAAIACAFAAYLGILFGRYEALMFSNDTRVIAERWADADIPAGSVVIIDSERMRLLGTTVSADRQNALDPSSLRAEDRVMMEDGSYAPHPFDLYSIFYATPAEQRTMVDEALSSTSSPKYFIFDSYNPNKYQESYIESRGTLVEEFVGSTNDASEIELPIGGERGQSKTMSMISQLYGMDRFGPDVFIYRLK